jgi:hypothetical protein
VNNDRHAVKLKKLLGPPGLQARALSGGGDNRNVH